MGMDAHGAWGCYRQERAMFSKECLAVLAASWLVLALTLTSTARGRSQESR